MGIFTGLGKAWKQAEVVSPFRQAAEQIQAQRGVLADHLTIRWLATAITERTELSVEEAVQLVVGVATGGGPDLRTSKGMSCASIILGVPGTPIQPTLH